MSEVIIIGEDDIFTTLGPINISKLFFKSMVAIQKTQVITLQIYAIVNTSS